MNYVLFTFTHLHGSRRYTFATANQEYVGKKLTEALEKCLKLRPSPILPLYRVLFAGLQTLEKDVGKGIIIIHDIFSN